MPPGSSQKGTGKKGAAGAIARQRSRNTTPSNVPPSSSATSTSAATNNGNLPPSETVDAEYLEEIKFELFRNLVYDDLVDSPSSGGSIPDSRTLDAVLARLQRINGVVDIRNTSCDRGMRVLSQTRKARMDEHAEEQLREAERLQKEAEKEKDERKKRKRSAADSLAPQEENTEHSSPIRKSKKEKERDNDDVSSSLSPVAVATPTAMEIDEKKPTGKKDEANDSDDSSDDGAPPPRPVPQNQTFGEDPSTFPDPTVYDIRDVTPDMTVDERKEIYSVAVFPKSDLGDLIAGDPPDKDFSNAKPSNQISFSTFSTATEPYFRPFTEEDLGFLRERGDRVTPFVMPKRGKRHFAEIWAEEDGAMAIDSSPPAGHDKLPPNQPRGSIEDMTDVIGETDRVSVGPLLTRLLQAMRPEHRPVAEDKPSLTNGESNGDISMNGHDPFMDSLVEAAAQQNGDAPASTAIPPATYMPESSSEAWKRIQPIKLDYNQVDERIKQELRHIGFLPLDPSQDQQNGQTANGSGSGTSPPPAANSGAGQQQQPDPLTTADYDGHFDDEVAARLRFLQSRLREQMLINGAHKARLTELVKERMAHQEYSTILEDLDSQVQAAYLERTRTMGKGKKAKRPGGAAAAGAGAGAAGGASGVAGTAGPGIGDAARMLMERRKKWIDSIGGVFDDGNMGKVPRVANPGSSIFQGPEMAELLKREKQLWDEEADEE